MMSRPFPDGVYRIDSSADLEIGLACLPEPKGFSSGHPGRIAIMSADEAGGACVKVRALGNRV